MLQLNPRISWRSALAETLLATIFCIMTVGTAFLPSEYTRVSRLVAKRPLNCWPLHNGQAIMLADAMPAEVAAGLGGKAILWHAGSSSSDLPPPLELSNEAFCLALDPRGTQLFVGYRNGVIEHCRVGDCPPELASFGFVPGLSELACAPDGRFLLTAGERGLELWNVAPGGVDATKPPRLLLAGAIHATTISPCSGLALAGVTTTDRRRLLVEIDLQEGVVTNLLELSDGPRKLVISPDGTHLAAIFASTEILMCQRGPNGEGWRPLEGFGLHAVSPRLVSFSPDSSRFITCQRSGSMLDVWDLRAQRLLEPVTTPITVLQGCALLDPRHVLLWGVNDRIKGDLFDRLDVQVIRL